MACHNAIWEHAERLLAAEQNPDHLAVDEVAAELTNHLIPDVVLTPGSNQQESIMSLASLCAMPRVVFLYLKDRALSYAELDGAAQRHARRLSDSRLVRIVMRRLAPGERWSAFLNEMRDAFLEIL